MYISHSSGMQQGWDEQPDVGGVEDSHLFDIWVQDCDQHDALSQHHHEYVGAEWQEGARKDQRESVRRSKIALGDRQECWK